MRNARATQDCQPERMDLDYWLYSIGLALVVALVALA